MKIKSITQYFVKGAELVHSAPEIWVVNVLMTLAYPILGQIFPHVLLGVKIILYLISVPLSFGFSLSIPYFLLSKQKPGWSIPFMLTKTVQNARRLVKPFMLFLFVGVPIICVSIFLILAFAGTFTRGTQTIYPPRALTTNLQTKDASPKASPSTNNESGPLFTMAFITAAQIIISPFYLVPIFFSVENYGLIRSAKKSLGFLIKHRQFWLTVMLAALLITLFQLIFTFGIERDFPWTKYIWFACNSYLSLVLMAGMLLYYKGHKN